MNKKYSFANLSVFSALVHKPLPSIENLISRSAKEVLSYN